MTPAYSFPNNSEASQVYTGVTMKTSSNSHVCMSFKYFFPESTFPLSQRRTWLHELVLHDCMHITLALIFQFSAGYITATTGGRGMN